MVVHSLENAKSSTKPPWEPELLPHILDSLANTTPQAVYAKFPISATSYDDGFFEVSLSAFANAVNGIAWWLEETLDTRKGFETLASLEPDYLRYKALLLGAVKAGYKLDKEVNEICPPFAKIGKSHILFVTPEKPMLRASKGLQFDISSMIYVSTTAAADVIEKCNLKNLETTILYL